MSPLWTHWGIVCSMVGASARGKFGCEESRPRASAEQFQILQSAYETLKDRRSATLSWGLFSGGAVCEFCSEKTVRYEVEFWQVPPVVPRWKKWKSESNSCWTYKIWRTWCLDLLSTFSNFEDVQKYALGVLNLFEAKVTSYDLYVSICYDGYGMLWRTIAHV